MRKLTIIVCALAFLSINVFAQTWTLQTNPLTGAKNSAWAVNNNIVWMCGEALTGGLVNLVKTTDGGLTWTIARGDMANGTDLYTISALDANTCFAGAGDGGLWRTTNGGTNWTFINLTPAAVFINVVHMFNSTYGFAQGDPVGGVWRYYITTNGGMNWAAGPNAPASVGTEAGWNNSYCALDTGHIWWGTNVSKILRGSFRGPFTSSPTTGATNSYGVWFNDATTGVANVNNGSTSLANRRSTDGGVTWSTTTFTPSQVTYALKGVTGTTYMWLGGGSTTSANIWRSTDNGATFTAQSITAAGAVYAMTFVHQGLGWVGLSNGAIYKYTDPNFTGTGNNQNQIPASFNLEQNYPNPFNPSTNINFSIPSASNVSIKVYDMLGHEVMTLVNEHKNAGNYSVVMDASSLSSGVYFYKIIAGSFTDTKKMTLVK